jgi:hypothetical protein
MCGDFAVKGRSLRYQRAVCEVGLVGKGSQNLELFKEFWGADECRKVVLLALIGRESLMT